MFGRTMTENYLHCIPPSLLCQRTLGLHVLLCLYCPFSFPCQEQVRIHCEDIVKPRTQPKGRTWFFVSLSAS